MIPRPESVDQGTPRGGTNATLLVLSGVVASTRPQIAAAFERSGIGAFLSFEVMYESICGGRPEEPDTTQSAVAQISEEVVRLLGHGPVVIDVSDVPTVADGDPLCGVTSWCRQRSIPVVFVRLVHDDSDTSAGRSVEYRPEPGREATRTRELRRDACAGSKWIAIAADDLDPVRLVKVIAPVLDGRQSSLALPDSLATREALAELGAALRAGDERWSHPASEVFGDIERQLSSDATHPRVMEAWGRSSLLDAEGHVIVDRAAAEILHSIAGLAIAENLGHAGILHTYGYLLSVDWTPHGWKRDRWINGDVAATLDVDPGLLGADPPTGTLLSNLTSFLFALTGVGGTGTENAEAGLDVGAMTRALVTETVEAASDCRHVPPPMVYRTYLWRRVDPPRIPEPNLLVYTVEDEDRERLVTAFPVTNAYRRLLTEGPFDGRIRPQYNYRPPDGSTSFSGTRTIEEGSAR